ncbi:MAG: hypothetical protein Q7R55_01515 [Candidatus Wildermuthbacteria bacterium]|nr:hypothetical protein [Candidatus Wildermuthbacteria bacterium]
MKKLFFAVSAISLLAMPFVVAADITGPAVDKLPTQGLPDTGVKLEALITAVVNWVFAIFVAIGVIFIVMAGLQFVTGGGDPAKVSEARQKLIWAIAGFAVALLARAIKPLIISLLGLS